MAHESRSGSESRKQFCLQQTLIPRGSEDAECPGSQWIDDNACRKSTRRLRGPVVHFDNGDILEGSFFPPFFETKSWDAELLECLLNCGSHGKKLKEHRVLLLGASDSSDKKSKWFSQETSPASSLGGGSAEYPLNYDNVRRIWIPHLGVQTVRTDSGDI